MSEPVNNLLRGLAPDQRRRITNALMADQYNRPTPHDGPVTERAGMFPLGTYANGQTGIAWPGFIAQPVESFVNLLRNGYQGGTGDTQGVEDAFNVAGGAMVGGLVAPRPRGSLGMSGNVKGSRPEPGARGPEAEATGASRVLAETSETIPVRDVARQVADEFGYQVYNSSGPVGYSSYIRTPIGDIRISDHPIGERRVLTEPAGYDFQQGAAAISDDIRKRLAAAEARATERQAQMALETVARYERTAPIRAEQDANRQAKIDFWQRNGLLGATATAREKAWKNFKRGGDQ